MPLKKIPGDQAWAFLRSSNVARWPTRENPDRLYPIASPENKLSFSIDKSDNIFCIGSCFAREIENTLQDLDFNVLSIVKNLPPSSPSNRGLLNKYNVYAILNELRWALLDNYTKEYLIKTPTGLYQDYQLMGSGYSDTLENVMQFHNTIIDTFKRIKNANIIILTLGLSEVWFDKKTGVYLNHTPSFTLIKSKPERFELHILDYSETVAALDEIYVLLCANTQSNVRFLISVSPIPLSATFRDQDVLIANSYSKALLRTAIESLSIKHSNINYFPSYEFVTLSSPDVVWCDRDLRHVDDSFVEYIVSTALQRYVAENNKDFNKSRAIAKSLSLYRGNFINEAKTAIKPALSTHVTKASTLQAFAIWNLLNLKIKNTENKLLFSISKLFHFKYLKRLFKSRQHWVKLPVNKGHIDKYTQQQISGWLLGDEKGTSGKVAILVNDKKIMEVEANLPRPDVAQHYGKQYHYSGFCINFNMDKELLNNIRVIDAKTKRQIVS